MLASGAPVGWWLVDGTPMAVRGHRSRSLFPVSPAPRADRGWRRLYLTSGVQTRLRRR